MSNLIFTFTLNLAWAVIMQHLNLSERRPGLGDGEIDGKTYYVSQHGEILYIVFPETGASEECDETVQKIIRKLTKAKVELTTLGHASAHCNYCLTFAITYRCSRCRGWYCKEHTPKERHSCPDSHGGEEAAASYEKASREEGEIVVEEIPCG